MTTSDGKYHSLDRMWAEQIALAKAFEAEHFQKARVIDAGSEPSTGNRQQRRKAEAQRRRARS